jgi:glycine/D-amino acid oxidase-like deaminating enzyme
MKSYDTLILGGGPAGIGAAVAAARAGASVGLIERHDVLGGMGTAALVNNFCPAHLDGSRLIIGGIFAEIRERLARRKAIFLSPGCAYAMEPYDPKAMEEECAALCREAGVTVFLGRSVTRSAFPAPDRAEFELDDGTALTARTVVDATGDAILAPAAGTSFQMGGAGRSMPLTFCYKLGPVDIDALRAKWPWCVGESAETGEPTICIAGCAQDEVAAAKAAGELTIPVKGIAAVLNIPGQPDYVTVNFGRVFVKDATDPAQLAAAEVEGRRQITEGEAFFRKYIPGFANARVVEIARQIGVRETRRIEGIYTLSEDDVLQCRQFDDAIAQCCYAIDVHDPQSTGTRLIELPRGEHFDIPLRCLIPRDGAPNVIYAGRCISADQAAMSSFRVSPGVMAIGEAAGVTAALAAANGASIRSVDPQAVRKVLTGSDGILE